MQGCTVALRRVEGPDAREVFLHCEPPGGSSGAGEQAAAIYRAILEALESEGAGFESVVCETVFLRDLGENIGAIRAAREEVLASCDPPVNRGATVELEQPPVNPNATLEVSVQAVIPRDSKLRVEMVEAEPGFRGAECASSSGVRARVGDDVRFQAGGICGEGEDAYAQTREMFAAAERLLEQAGMSFHDVVRTWIHLRDIGRDYDDFNRGRRAFFDARGIDPIPASTGIGGGPVSDAHALCLGIYAVQSELPRVRSVMTSPTLNEAPQYGADFVRGMKIAEGNKVALHVSGTASVDEAGKTAHAGDFDAQADRMLLNIAALLEGQGAGYRDVVSGISYVKDAADASRLREKFRAKGFDGFPIAMVNATVCRPDLLCETEVLAVLPAGAD